MKQEVERLLVFLIPAVFIQNIFNALSSHAIRDLIYDLKYSYPEIFPDETPGELMPWIIGVDNFLTVLPTVVIAVWLWKLEKRQNGRPYLWALGGLFLNYWILLLFIGQRLYVQNKTQL
jgi:hypothetical protein